MGDPYYGLYHSIIDGYGYKLFLGQSLDLQNWERVSLIDEHASQGKVWVFDNGSYLLMYEVQDPRNSDNFIRLRYFMDMNAVKSGNYLKQKDIPRTVGPTSEGTPSFESVKLVNDDLDNSEIKIRFHYF